MHRDNFHDTIHDAWKHESIHNLVTCFLILIAYLIIRRYFSIALKRWAARPSQIKGFDRQRFAYILDAFARGLLGFIFWVLIINTLFHDTAKALMGLGLVSVGLGFALQAAIRDYISGALILFEGQLQIGQKVTINKDYTGLIQRIDLRTTHMLLDSGQQLTIINSEIKSWQLTPEPLFEGKEAEIDTT